MGSYGGEEDQEQKKEKRLMKMVGEVVVRSMSKYKEMMDHETFKKYARDVSHIVRHRLLFDPKLMLLVHAYFGGKGEAELNIPKSPASDFIRRQKGQD